MTNKGTKISIPCSPEEYYYKLDNMLLSSSQCVRNTFKRRWKAETNEDWVDDNNNIQKFIKNLGSKAFKQAQSFQKKYINESSSLDDWDMSLLSVIIRNFGDETKYEKENLAVRQLKDLRNELAHNSNKKFTEAQYNKHVVQFKESVLYLGLCESDVDKLIERAGVTSSLKAYERVKDLFEKAEKFMKEDKFKEAIDRYSEAITTPSLLPINLGETYEKRANCYLKSVKSEIIDGDHCDQALLDIQQALELNSSSWNANYLAAQCYRRKNNLHEALRYYETALALSPAQKKVKRDWDTCKVLAGVYYRKDNLNPHLMPMSLDERVEHFNNETGLQISKDQFLKENRDLAGMVVKGQDHVFRGHQHFYGWDVQQNFTEAVKYYTKADIVGNPEGSYNLAVCYQYGLGVEDDVVRAFKIYKRVAEMDKNTLGQFTPLNCNVGVAGAQHALGLCYANGTGVEQDYKEAAIWYRKAMENGVGNAANNLGLLYAKGQGVEFSEKMAEMCWKQGVSLKDVNAADSLVGYYFNQMEPELAEKWIKIGREMGSDKLRGTSDEEFNRILVIFRNNREHFKPMVTEFEKRYNLDAKGLTFQQRLTRAQNHEDPNMAKILNVFRNTIIEDITPAPSFIGQWGGQRQPLTPEICQALYEKAWQGSAAANRIIQTIDISSELNHLLLSDKDNSKKFKLNIINMLYECAILEFHFFFVNSSENKQRLKNIVAELFEETCERKGEDDLKNRLCYLLFNLHVSLFRSDDTYALEILKEGVRRYPNDPDYNIILICCMEGRKLWKEGVLYAKEALVKLPDDAELLYHLAVCLRNCQNVSYLEIVSAFENFLDAAPRENRKVPEAFYNIASAYLLQLKNENTTDVLDKIRLYVRQGTEAEKDQLPCYLPYGESSVKQFVIGFLGKLDETEDTLNNGMKQKNVFISPKSVLERKHYLQSPVRKDLILQHRQKFDGISIDGTKITKTVSPKLTQTVAKKLSTLKPITLQEMNPTEDKIFDDRLLELTIIDDPCTHFPSIHLVAEDENGDTTRLYIYNVKRNVETIDRFRAGSRIAIINPYMRIGSLNPSNGIRNDEIKCIVDLEKVKKMCRFCGEKNSILVCKICRRPYCSPECVNLDFKLFNHKLICSPK